MPGGIKHNLEKASLHVQAEIHERASQLARLHERRDREIVEIQRYEAVQGLVYQDAGVNRFQVHVRLLLAVQGICKLAAHAVGHRAKKLHQELWILQRTCSKWSQAWIGLRACVPGEPGKAGAM